MPTTTANGTYGVGEIIDIQVALKTTVGPISVTGTPQLILVTKQGTMHSSALTLAYPTYGNPRTVHLADPKFETAADYVSTTVTAAGATYLTFRYKVLANHFSSDLDYTQPVVVRESAPITTPPSNSTAIIDVPVRCSVLVQSGAPRDPDKSFIAMVGCVVFLPPADT